MERKKNTGKLQLELKKQKKETKKSRTKTTGKENKKKQDWSLLKITMHAINGSWNCFKSKLTVFIGGSYCRQIKGEWSSSNQKKKEEACIKSIVVIFRR